MSDKKDKKLDFDLGFLDKESPKPKQSAKAKRSKTRSEITDPSSWDDWKIIATIGGVILGVILVIILLGSSDDSTPVPTPPSTTTPALEEDTVIVGEYECSRYHHNRAEELSPDESESQLTSEKFRLDQRANGLNRLWNDIESSYVTEYSSQYAIDAYNADVEEFKSELADYEWDKDAFNSRIVRYNVQIEARSSYLMRNCTAIR